MNMKDMSFDDIVNWVKINGLSELLIDKLNEAIETHNNSLSKEEKYNQLLKNINELDNLYNTNRDFSIWCRWLKEIVLYDEYIQSCERNYAKAEFYDNEKDYYIPCITNKLWSSECNPYFYNHINNTIIYVKRDFDHLIMDSEAFSCFWKHKMNTELIPTFNVSEDEESSYEQIDSDKYENYYKRQIYYNSYNKKELDKIWEDKCKQISM